MITNLQLRQHVLLESEVLIFVTFEADFEKLERNVKILNFFRENNYFPSLLFFYRKFPIQKCCGHDFCICQPIIKEISF